MSDGGWPADWSERKAGRGCPMCASLGSQVDDDHGVFVCEMPSTEVRLQRRSRLPGYCVVAWRHGHVAEATELEADAATRYWSDVLAVSSAIDGEFTPMKMNLLTLGNWVPHLHTHVVPRYVDDPAPGQPLPWRDMFDDSPGVDANLHDVASKLRARLGTLS
ncbi:MAG: HIT domain-containing protein [Actinobacteria bacterium]|nr:HIT domain-containing protein [Actinomycetota bacterium]MBV9253994.1 HIT domain-containing protein [Actinomycetota bacterium]